ncbi:MAG: hypothetical protein M1815_000204 [Lichina confinis]|nr:MAG: hypothetical protein M1815_000204 [Lichina confinis]
MAEKYLLRVSAGPGYDQSTHGTVNVNSAEPFHVSSRWGEARLHVRIRNYRGLPKGSPKTCPYFEHPLHTSDLYSISFDIVPKARIPGNDLLFGNDFDEPIRNRLPPGFEKAFKLVKWVIDPGLEGDPYADEPYLYGPALSSLNVLRVCKKSRLLQPLEAGAGRSPDHEVVEEGAEDDGEVIRDAIGIPKDAGARKKFFLNEANRKLLDFEADRLYRMDFFNPYLDFNAFALKLPGFSIPILSFLDAREVKSHKLRYVLKNRATGEVYFVVVFTVLGLEDVAKEEAAEAGQKGTPGEADFVPRADDLD